MLKGSYGLQGIATGFIGCVQGFISISSNDSLHKQMMFNTFDQSSIMISSLDRLERTEEGSAKISPSFDLSSIWVPSGDLGSSIMFFSNAYFMRFHLFLIIYDETLHRWTNLSELS